MISASFNSPNTFIPFLSHCNSHRLPFSNLSKYSYLFITVSSSITIILFSTCSLPSKTFLIFLKILSTSTLPLIHIYYCIMHNLSCSFIVYSLIYTSIFSMSVYKCCGAAATAVVHNCHLEIIVRLCTTICCLFVL